MLVRTSLEVASNTTKHLVSLCRCLFNVCGPFEILCQGDTQVLRLCCCCEDLIVQLLKMVAALFSNMHDLTFFFVLKRIPQHGAQRLSASTSCWRSSWSCSENIDLYTRQSSANKRIAVPGSKTLGRSLTNNRKSSVPNWVCSLS